MSKNFNEFNDDFQELLDALEIMAEEKKKKAIDDFEKQLNEETNAIILEAVRHFKTTRFRRYGKDDFDERYFYNESELNRFLELNKNPQVKIRTEYDEKIPNKVYCYIAYR